MKHENGVEYGITGSRGAMGCGGFHEFLPGPDGFCACCRPAPDHPTIQAASRWMIRNGQPLPDYGSAEWRGKLQAWDQAGRPNSVSLPCAAGRHRVCISPACACECHLPDVDPDRSFREAMSALFERGAELSQAAADDLTYRTHQACQNYETQLRRIGLSDNDVAIASNAWHAAIHWIIKEGVKRC